MLVDVAREEEAVAAAERIRRILGGRFEVRGHLIEVSSTVGVGYSNSRLYNVEALVRRADIAMYSANARPSSEPSSVSAKHLD